MSTLRSGRLRRRTLCAMVQLHCWLPRTTDPVAMPFRALAILAPTLASGVLHVVARLADAAGAKAAPAKPASKEKTTSGSASQPAAFAAYLAALAAPQTALPQPAASTVKTALQNGSIKSINGAPGSGLHVPAPGAKTAAKDPLSLAMTAKSPATPAAAVVTAKTPTSPTASVRTVAPVAGRVPAHATPESLQAARAPAAPNVPVKPLSREGKGEVHLGTHTSVASPPGEVALADSEQAAPTISVAGTLAPVTAEAPKQSEVSSAAGVRPEPSVAAVPEHVSAVASPEGHLLTPAEPDAVNGPVSRLLTASATGSTRPLPSVQHASQLFAASASADHDSAKHAPAPPAPATSSPAPAPSAAPALAVPNAAPVSQASAAAVTTPVPVSQQLTHAFLAQADVVQRDGRTDFHLRLDPPQLGSVQIHLRATEHTVSARIVVAHEGTRQLLESQAQNLRQGLAQAGLSLGSFDVTRDGGGSYRGGQQAPPHTPFTPPTSLTTPRGNVPVSTTALRSTDGINILA